MPSIFSIAFRPRWLIKAGQLGLFDERKPVQAPGTHGSVKWFYNRYGKVEYGEEVDRRTEALNVRRSVEQSVPRALLSTTGREVPLPPKIRLDTDRKAGADLKRVNEWLLTEARKEVEARNDDYVRTLFARMDPKRLSQGDKDELHTYLFGEEQLTPENFAKSTVFGIAFCAPPRLRFVMGERRCA